MFLFLRALSFSFFFFSPPPKVGDPFWILQHARGRDDEIGRIDAGGRWSWLLSLIFKKSWFQNDDKFSILYSQKCGEGSDSEFFDAGDVFGSTCCWCSFESCIHQGYLTLFLFFSFWLFFSFTFSHLSFCDYHRVEEISF